ncbi:MAG: hypothetical protein MR844_03105 [Clostridia bacterium]|nr:hypothetical protein [Clostridia bacterium]
MKSRTLKPLLIAISCVAIAACTISPLRNKKPNASAVGVDAAELFSVMGGEIFAGNALPSYVEKVKTYDGNVALRSDISGVEIKANADVKTVTAEYSKKLSLRTLCDDYPLIEFMATPAEKGADGKTYAFNKLSVILTDVNNDNNFIEITLTPHLETATQTCARARSAKQGSYGRRQDGKLDNAYGLIMQTNFCGYGQGDGVYETASFYFDPQTAIVKASRASGVSGLAMVRDLDSSADITGDDEIWEGFSSDEVSLSVKMESVSRAGASLTVFSVNGTRLSGEAKDEVAPVAEIEKRFIENGTPYGKSYTAYPLPSVTVYDNFDGKTSDFIPDAEVYYAYKEANEKRFAVVNGAFVPEETGNYTAKYNVTDKSGNSAVVEFNVKVFAELVIEAEFKNPDEKTEYVIGETFNVPEIKISGGSGLYSYSVAFVNDNGEQIETADGNIALEKEGVYTLKYMIVDYVGNVRTLTRKITVSGRRTPLIEEVVMPKFAIKGIKLGLPKATAYDFYSYRSRIEVPSEIFVSSDKNEWKLVNGEFTPETEGKIYIKYVARNVIDGEAAEKVYSVTVLSPARAGDYFTAENGDITTEYPAKTNETAYTTSTDGAKLSFINKLSAAPLVFNFFIDPLKSAFDSLTITLQDAEAVGEVVETTIARGGDTTCKISVNGRNEKEFSSSAFSVKTIMNLSYSNGWIKSGDVKLIAVNDYKNGEPFNGFSSDTAYLSVTFNGVKGESSIRILKVNNQIINKDTEDTTGPFVGIKGEIKKAVKTGDIIVVPAVFAVDVLSVGAEVSVSVIDPDGNSIAMPNVSDGFKFVAEKRGVYYVLFTATDIKGNAFSSSYSVVVHSDRIDDFEVGTIPQTVKVGQTVELSAPNVGKEYKVSFFVKSSDGQLTDITEARAHRFDVVGRHYLYCYVYDENSFSYRIKKIPIEVTA